MPLAPCMSVLSGGIQPILTKETAPASTADAATAWARAWVAYALAGGLPSAPAKEQALAAALLTAFAPTGSGPALMIQALALFWTGQPVPIQAGVVLPPILTFSAPAVPPNPTPKQHADAIASMLHGATMSALKVQNLATGAVTPIV